MIILGIMMLMATVEENQETIRREIGAGGQDLID